MGLGLVLAGKIFRLAEPLSLEAIRGRLEGYRREEEAGEGAQKLRLVTEVERVSSVELGLEGVISYDRLVWIPRRDGPTPIARTYTAPFLFSTLRGETFLLVVEKKHRANRIADLFSEILFGGYGGIVEARIPPENLHRYHEENPEGTKVVFFCDLDFPGVKKLSLYGGSLHTTATYDEMLGHGKLWYVVVTSKRYGYVVGLTGDAIVTVFSRIAVDEFLRYVVDEVLPLVEL